VADKNSPVGLDIGLSARAEFRAEVKAEVPPASVGRLVDALTDVIRPFTESRGLRADQLRLQREEVLLEIAKKAKARIEMDGAAIRPVPAKFLVPFLEKASLEGEGSKLVELWANLLANAATGDADELTWCISILSEITPDDAALLDGMFEKRKEFNDSIHFENFTRSQLQRSFDWIFSDELPVRTLDQIATAVESEFDFMWLLRGDDVPNTNEVHLPLSGLQLGLSRLESIGLLWVFAQSCHVRREPGSEAQYDEVVFVTAAQLTPKGRALVAACRGLD
jgi:hypothetical protein